MFPQATENSVVGHMWPAGLWLDYAALHNGRYVRNRPLLKTKTFLFINHLQSESDFEVKVKLFSKR